MFDGMKIQKVHLIRPVTVDVNFPLFKSEINLNPFSVSFEYGPERRNAREKENPLWCHLLPQKPKSLCNIVATGA